MKNIIQSVVSQEERITALHKYDVLIIPAESAFYALTDLAALVCQTPISLISFIDDKRESFKFRKGFDTIELAREISFAQFTISQDAYYEVPDMLEAEDFNDHPMVSEAPHIRFYAGVPLITPQGHPIGTLAVMDQATRSLSQEQRTALRTIGRQVVNLLELQLSKNGLNLQHEVLNADNHGIRIDSDFTKNVLYETSSVVITDTKGIIQYVNQRFRQVSKYSEEELLGENIRIVFSGLHSRDYIETIWRTLENGQEWTGELRHIAKDGSYYWSDTKIIPILNDSGKPFRYIGIQHDITKIKIEREQYERFFNLSVDFLVISGQDGSYKKVSPSFTKELGYTEEELLSMNSINLLHPDDLAVAAAGITNLVTSKKSEADFILRLKTKSGDYKSFSWSGNIEVETGLMYAAGRNITTALEKEKELIKLSLVAQKTDNLVVITDEHRKTEWVNKSFEVISGYSLDECIGLNPAKLLHGPDTNPTTIKVIREALNNQQGFSGEILNYSKSGATYWIHMSITPIFDHDGRLYRFIAIERDITRQKEEEKEIENLLNIQEAILNGTDHMMIFTAPDGMIKKVNSSVETMLEYAASELVDKESLLTIYDAHEVKSRAETLTKELGKKIPHGIEALVIKAQEQHTADVDEWTYCTKSGKRIPALVSLTCIRDKEANILGFLAVGQDYTTRKKIASDLLTAKDMAERSLLLKDDFLSNMSHEIRTPMNAIIGFTDLLSQTSLDKEQQESVQNVKSAGENLMTIINDILDLSKISSGKITIDKELFSIKNTVKNVYDLLKPRSIDKKLEYNLFLDEEMPEYGVGDSARLNQILMNLIGNAIKFTEHGSVTVSVKKIEETDHEFKLLFCIKDTGIGIPEDKLDEIFERFTQVQYSKNRKFGGTGLGLNICKLLIDAQGGEINVKSQPNIGSEFFFSLTYGKIANLPDEQAGKSQTIDQSYGNVRILLCEDNILNQKLAKSVIGKFGFELDIANNGLEGLEKFKENTYNLLLMDLQMPEMDGYQTTIYIRNHLKSEIPIIAMTAHSMIGEKEKCIEIGMNDYLAKPYKKDELYSKIISFLMPTSKESASLQPIQQNQNNPLVDMVHLNYLKQLSGGDQEFEKEMIRLFLEQMPVELDFIRKSIDENDLIQIKQIIHKIKPSLSLFGLEHLEEQFKQLAMHDSDQILPPNGKNIFSDLKDSFNHSYQQLEDILKNDYN